MTTFQKYCRRGVAVAVLAAVPLASNAQQVTGGGQTASQRHAAAAALQLPDITVFGTFDPNVRKATAIVNGDIITDTDVDHRLALVMIANSGNVSHEEKEVLRLQVLRNLIDEKLQIQEAAQNEVKVPEEEVEQAYSRVAANFRQSKEAFEVFLRENGSSPASIKQQIRAEITWNRLLRRKVEPFINVGDDEVQAVIRKLEEAKGKDEFRVGEIFLSATPETQGQAMADAARIVEQVRNGASFVAYARQFSEASSAALGGDLGWVRAEQLSPALQGIVTALPRGGVSDPVPVPGGVTVIALVDKRQVLSADPSAAILSLKQMTLPLPDNITEAEARKLAANMQEKTRNMGGCGKADEVARSIGAAIVSNDQLRMGDLPQQLQQILGQMPIGAATPPFGSAQDGLRVLVLCGRDDPPANANVPSFDQVYGQLNDTRVNSAARRYLRDLRRDAVIDYR
ncbi:peptidylprolyl isomerase [Sandaracinobacter neustonicus]|uniref:Parvulin-like PPIase n=1 Tax=Sandaracinobacter neustonicus TaxID=1715348 RepID=A0A501XK29_9SPHN|nr:peptidylprolyl isomerase [Sandaracinobacter neustonicus]TPE61048.1 peptidylprolyl isomerase [Sandaracinobacter neustonicus]